jgi:hypothetical protein
LKRWLNIRRKKRSSNSPFGAMQNAAVGIAGIGVISAAQGFNTLAGFVPIATTVYVAKSLLPKRKKSYGF